MGLSMPPSPAEEKALFSNSYFEEVAKQVQGSCEHPSSVGACFSCVAKALLLATQEATEKAARIAELHQDIVGWQPGESRNKLCFKIAQKIRESR